MARVDDVVFNYLRLPKNAVQNDCIKGALEDAVRYGFQQGESFGKYVKYAAEVEDKYMPEILNECGQEKATKKKQTVVRTFAGVSTAELQRVLDKGWTVALVNSVGGNTLEYILEKAENLGNSETVKNPEE